MASPEHAGRAPSDPSSAIFRNAVPFAPPMNARSSGGAWPEASKLPKLRKRATATLSPVSPMSCLYRSGRCPDGPAATPAEKDRMAFATVSSVISLAARAGILQLVLWLAGGSISLERMMRSVATVSGARPKLLACRIAVPGRPLPASWITSSCRLV
eukprot:9101370-Pyramimonas_sp.AAC.1